MASINFKKLWDNYGIGAIIILIIVAYTIVVLMNYFLGKNSYGYESITSTPNSVYGNGSSTEPTNSVEPSSPDNRNEDYSSVDSVQKISTPNSCNSQNIQNPEDLLPKDTNSAWAVNNPCGNGELANINLLKAGYHIGIDSIGQTLRNANLQIRSEPPNPQVYVGPWNQSTITPDFLRPPLEIGVGSQ